MNLTLYETHAFNSTRVVPLQSSRLQVSLLIETSSAFGRGLLRGVQSYRSRHADWRTFVPEQRLGKRPPQSLRPWRGDGVITCIRDPRVVRAVQDWGVPTIDVSPTGSLRGFPSVSNDERAISAMAFDHLYGQGFQQFAFYETKGRACAARSEFFHECAQEADLPCHIRSSSERQELRSLATWLKSLPRPTGIMACSDRLGLQLVEACRLANIHVPREVAIVCVGNDELLCEMADPPLSSVFPDAERIGYLAASYLDILLAGNDDIPQETQVRPIGVVARQSSDSFAIDDPDVAAAARFIRDHAKEGIKVADVLDAVPMSRRVLESRFRKWFGCTPHREILRVQLSHVRALIRDTDLSLERIAARCGFRHVEYMSVVFKRELGCTPSEYRQSVA